MNCLILGLLYIKKEIKNIYNKLNDTNTNTHKNKSENKQNEIKNLELLKDIASLIKIEFANLL